VPILPPAFQGDKRCRVRCSSGFEF
jgi:hypothetical protein